MDDALCFERSVHQIVLVEGLYLLQQPEGSLACNDLPEDVANKNSLGWGISFNAYEIVATDPTST